MLWFSIVVCSGVGWSGGLRSERRARIARRDFARSTFASQNHPEKMTLSRDFWKLRTAKFARRCGEKHTCKSKLQKKWYNRDIYLKCRWSKRARRCGEKYICIIYPSYHFCFPINDDAGVPALATKYMPELHTGPCEKWHLNCWISEKNEPNRPPGWFVDVWRLHMSGS